MTITTLDALCLLIAQRLPEEEVMSDAPGTRTYIPPSREAALRMEVEKLEQRNKTLEAEVASLKHERAGQVLFDVDYSVNEARITERLIKLGWTPPARVTEATSEPSQSGSRNE